MFVCPSCLPVTGILAIHVLLPFALVAEVGDVLIAIMMFAIPVTQLNQIVLIQNPSFRAILSVEFVDTWKSVTLCTCAFGDNFMQLGLHNQSKAPALLVNSSLSGKDAEGWAGHHGASFACTFVAYLKKVVVC